MDQQKIGRFICEQRKKNNLTQRQLAEKLGLSEKTISKWECGNGMPDVSIMVPLCEIFKISVNELLNGQLIDEMECKEKSEQILLQNLKQQKSDNKLKLVASFMVAIFGVVILCLSICLSAFLPFYGKILLVLFGGVSFLLGLIFAIFLDIRVGTFECPHCHERYTPTISSYILGMHTISKRHMKCPKCKRYGWHTHNISEKK